MVGDIAGGAIVRQNIEDGTAIQSHPAKQISLFVLALTSKTDLPIPACQQYLCRFNRTTSQSSRMNRFQPIADLCDIAP